MPRFVRPEPVAGAEDLVRVWDEPHGVFRAQRTVEGDERLRERLRAVAKVQHPALAALVAVADDGAKVVTEWLPGGEVSDLGPREATRVLLLVADALIALHDHHLAHGGDLLLLYDGSGQPKLARAGLRPGDEDSDLAAFGRLVERVVTPPVPPQLAEVAVRAREGRYVDLRELRAAVAEARGAVGATSVVPMVRTKHAEADAELRVGWLLLALVPAIVLIGGAALLGWWAGRGP